MSHFVLVPESPPPPSCCVCGKPYAEHGSYPTCATHSYAAPTTRPMATCSWPAPSKQPTALGVSRMSEQNLPIVAWLVEYEGVRGKVRSIKVGRIPAESPVRQDPSFSETPITSHTAALEALSVLQKQLDECRADAERYRWLRAQHWHDGRMCVVVLPKLNVRPGSFCPSGELLDKEIDASLSSETQHG